MEGIIAAFLASGASTYTPLTPTTGRLTADDETGMRRIDYKLIEDLVPDGATVLDLACGDGELLSELIAEKHVRGSGVEIDQAAVEKCIGRGLSVFHGDLDAGLADFDDQSHDVVILSLSLQQLRRPRMIVREMVRVGRLAIVELPQLRPLGPALAAAPSRAHARLARPAVPVVGHAQHPPLHDPRTSARCAARRASASSTSSTCAPWRSRRRRGSSRPTCWRGSRSSPSRAADPRRPLRPRRAPRREATAPGFRAFRNAGTLPLRSASQRPARAAQGAHLVTPPSTGVTRFKIKRRTKCLRVKSSGSRPRRPSASSSRRTITTSSCTSPAWPTA